MAAATVRLWRAWQAKGRSAETAAWIAGLVGFGVQVHQNDFGLGGLEQLVGGAKGIIVGGHEDAALQIEDGVGDPFATPIEFQRPP